MERGTGEIAVIGRIGFPIHDPSIGIGGKGQEGGKEIQLVPANKG